METKNKTEKDEAEHKLQDTKANAVGAGVIGLFLTGMGSIGIRESVVDLIRHAGQQTAGEAVGAVIGGVVFGVGVACIAACVTHLIRK